MIPKFAQLLDQPPRIIRIGRAIHGIRGKERFRFPNYWCLHHYHYPLKLELDGNVHSIGNGGLTLIPADTQMVYYFDHHFSEHEYAIFELQDQGTRKLSPLVLESLDVPKDFATTFNLAVDEFPSRSQRSRSLLWHLLWMFAGEAERKPLARNPLVDRAARHIEDNLELPLSISEIADFLGVSHNHLTRQFQSEFGQGVAAYLNDRRMELARHLLESTDLPIKVIAQECGCPDPHAFNKAFRRTTGKSPSSYRVLKN